MDRPIGLGWLSASERSASSPVASTASDEEAIASKTAAAVRTALG